MGRRHFKPKQIIHMLREVEIKLAGGKTTGEVCRELGIFAIGAPVLMLMMFLVTDLAGS